MKSIKKEIAGRRVQETHSFHFYGLVTQPAGFIYSLKIPEICVTKEIKPNRLLS